MKKNKIFTRILSGFLCFIILLGIAVPFVHAEGEISGLGTIMVDLNNWQNKVSTYVYTIKSNPGAWDVLYGITEGKTTSYYRIPDAIKKLNEIGNDDTFVNGITFYKISNYQIALAVDSSYVPRTGTNNYKLRIVNGAYYMDVAVTCQFGKPNNNYNNGSQIYMSSQVIDATTQGVNYYLPFSSFKYTPATGAEDDVVTSVSINPDSRGLNVLRYTDFIKETETNFGYTWPKDLKESYHKDDNNYYLIQSDYRADGTYIVKFQMKTGSNITKSLVINSGDISYNAEVYLENNVASIDIPTQNEGTKTIPITVNIYQGDLIQENIPYKVIVSPIASGIKIVNNSLVIEPTAVAGSYTIKILANTSSDVYGSVKFVLNRVQQDYITIKCADSLVIPVSGSTTTLLTADVFKDGMYNITEQITWELGSFYNGVSLNGDKLSVSSNALPSKISIIARLKSNSSVYSKKTIELTAPDTSLKPDSVHISGITNDTWEPSYPYGKSLNLSLYSMTDGKRNDNVELGLRMENAIPGMTIRKNGEFNGYEILANGIYEMKTVNLVVYCVNYPEISNKINLRIKPTLEGTVFTNSTLIKGGTIEAQGSLINNSSKDVDAVMVVAVYKDNQLISATPQDKKEKQSSDANSMTVFTASVKLPKDISGVTVKIMLLRGTTVADATELLAAPLVLK